jgi:class 3 adenylate cyclase/tetratricopeptide (TPR) repeat protein
MLCPSCGFDNPRDMRFCGACGTRLTVNCAVCGFANPLDFRFCGMCGTRLAPEAAEVPLPPQQLSVEAEAFPPITSVPALEGERRVVTVVVTDLTDSTHLLETIGTESWVELMHHILHILESEINRFGGEVSQFRGDGLVAFFGATSAHEDDPERAILASLAMQRAFEQYVHDQAPADASDLQMRVGVNTGEVIVTGESDREQGVETAMGAAVSIAARMESAAEPGTVLVSEHTHRLVETQFVWEVAQEITVKGVSQPIKVYRPSVHLANSLEPTYETFFYEAITRIGRDQEFRALKACVESVLEGSGHIATLTGEKGSGKAFLLSEARQYFEHRGALLAEAQADQSEASTSLRWINGRCRSYTETWPYSMWVNLFHNLLDIHPYHTKEEKGIRLRGHTEELWGERFDEHYPYLAAFLGFPLDDPFMERIRHLDAESLRQRIFLTVRSELEELSRRSPLVLSISDLQWADDSSLALLKYCLPVTDSEAVLWILALRPDRDSSVWDFYHDLEAEYPHRLTNIELQPLTEVQGLELISNLIGAETLPKETRNLIVQSAAGNPYYILELIRSLIVKGILTRASADAPWQLTRKITTLDLPDSLQRLLLARIDRLSTHERSVLQIASVIGLVFWYNVLEAILGETPTLRNDLIALQRNEFIQERGRIPELGMRYYFTTPLIRDAAYESLLGTQRAIYHLKAAEYLETNASPDVIEGYDGLIAHHYAGAGDSKKELFYTILAAEQARSIYANVEALRYYNRAMELLDTLEVELASEGKIRSIQTQRFEVLRGRRAVLLDLGEIEAARADTNALLPLANEMADDRVWLIDALLAHADFPYNNREELWPSLHMAEQALDLSREVGDQPRELSSLINVANLRLSLRQSNALEIAEEALHLARTLGDLTTEVNILVRIGNAYGVDDLPRSHEYLEAALARSESIKDKKIEILLLETLGRKSERVGDYYRQLTEYEQKRLSLSREIGNRYIEGQALMFCGQIQGLYLGDYEAGLAMQHEVLNTWESISSRLFPLLRIAQIQTAQRHFTEALATLEAARPLADKVVLDIGRAGLAMVLIILYNTLGEEPRLWSALDLVSEIKQMTSDNLVSRQYRMAAACEASSTHLQLARFLAERNPDEAWWHTEQALESSHNALELYQRFGFVQIVECTSEEIFFRHSQALAANEYEEDAAVFLKQAYTEMMRKHDLIPAKSPFRKTFLKNIQLHREIRSAYATLSAAQSSNPSI